MPKHIILGVTGSISAYKAPEIIRQFRKAGYRVTPVLTRSAQEFVTARAVSIVAEEPAITDHAESDLSKTTHIELAREADYLIIAPATANSIAKYAHGIADDVLSSLFLSFTKKKLVAPTMHTEMWENPITQKNIQELSQHDVSFIGPEVGDLASGDTGPGRLVAPELIVKRVSTLDEKDLSLKGKKVLITMGGTSEDLDVVRVLTNKSSGKLGDTLAKTAFFYGADVSVITTQPIMNPGYSAVEVVSNVDSMNEALQQHIDNCDVLYMAAAISDFKPKTKPDQKIRRQDNLSIELECTTDLLKSVKDRKKDKTYVGFCLASQDLENTAKEKLEKKGVDYIVANLPQVFGQDTRSVSIYSKENKFELNEKPIDTIAYELLKLAE